jgi:hypothetical protein
MPQRVKATGLNIDAGGSDRALQAASDAMQTKRA